jgi:hypothetical protein
VLTVAGDEYRRDAPHISWRERREGKMDQVMLFYCSDAGWPTRVTARCSGGESYFTVHEILGKVMQRLGPGDALGRIEIMGHGSEGMISFGGTGDTPGPSSIATTTGLIVHDPGVRSFWLTLREFMAPVGVVVLNSCNVGRGRAGDNLLREIATLTGAITCGALREMGAEMGMHYFNDASLYKKVYPPCRH